MHSPATPLKGETDALVSRGRQREMTCVLATASYNSLSRTVLSSQPLQVHSSLGTGVETHTLHGGRDASALPLHPGVRNRNQHRKRRTASAAADDLDAPSVSVHHVPHDGETEASPAHAIVNRRGRPVEPLEDPLLVIRRDADP